VLGQRIPISGDSGQHSDDGKAINTDKKEVWISNSYLLRICRCAQL
jgi:hypothetical protein